jgi:hypothetical protein
MAAHYSISLTYIYMVAHYTNFLTYIYMAAHYSNSLTYIYIAAHYTNFLTYIYMAAHYTMSNIHTIVYSRRFGLVSGVLRHFKQYVSYMVVVNFIGGGNRSIRRKPSIFRKSLTNFIT